MKLTRFAKDLLAGKWVEILRAGTWNRTTFTTDDLNKIASDYDPNFRIAPLVVGHPSMLKVEGERPAHGVITALQVIGDSLQAKIDNLSDEVRTGLSSGRWINRSIETMKFGRGDDRGWYLTGLALLGGSQPAVDAMLSDDGEKCCIDYNETESTEIDNSQPPPLTKGAANMDAAELKRLEAVELQAGEVKALKTEITQLSESLKAFTTELEGLKSLKVETEALKASSAAFLDAQAQIEVNKATAGIPKALCPDEKKTLLSEMYKTNRAAFDIEAKAFDVMRKSFAYLTTEIVPEVVEGAPVIDRKVNAEADDYSKRLALKVRELRANDKNISIEQAAKLAKEQVA